MREDVVVGESLANCVAALPIARVGDGMFAAFTTWIGRRRNLGSCLAASIFNSTPSERHDGSQLRDLPPDVSNLSNPKRHGICP